MLVNSHSGLERSASVGLVFCWLAVILTLLGGVLAFIGSFDADFGPAKVLVRHSDSYMPAYAVQVGAVSYFVFAYALWRLISFLRLSKAGRVFAAETTAHLRAFGRWLVVAAAAALVLPLLAVVMHTMILASPGPSSVPPLQVPLFSSLFALAIATLVMMICRVIDEGRRLRDELDEIV
ncbi:DUF2975 domain-containing protein [Sphingomonas sp. UV9]|uniref:DUF2975 domain-containing protein n=1 Tax=Sphingomonas sp. UV9 TaxID=1851410 RepID=UPI000FFC1CC5|nr:DUF2975 domain-containing protein [Sphingomonas sp. UV9]RXD02576.1 DUF2975 domain-containing protein [Sphingomonas sp. UV9]